MLTKCKVLGSNLLFYRGVCFEFDCEETRDRYASLLNNADQKQKYDLVRYYVKCILEEIHGTPRNLRGVNKSPNQNYNSSDLKIDHSNHDNAPAISKKDYAQSLCESESINEVNTQNDDAVPFEVTEDPEFKDCNFYVPD